MRLNNLITKIENKKINNSEIINYMQNISLSPTNCESAALRLFIIVGIICSHREELSKELLVHPLLPVYYLGIESLEDIKKYIKWLISEYMEPLEQNAIWLNKLLIQEDLIISSFNDMLKMEVNNKRRVI